MLIKRVVLIAALILAGFVIMSLGVWTLAFNANSSNVPTSDARWWAARTPILLGLVLIVIGFRVLSRTRVVRPLDEIDEEDAAG